MHELKLWQFILNELRKNQPVILLNVLESKGSSPGRQGFKMAVATDEICGSIGGGAMEYKFVEMAKKKLHENSVLPILRKQFHSKEAASNQSGMICSGAQTIYLYPLQKSDIAHIENLISTLENNRNGQYKISPSGLYFSNQVIPQSDYRFSYTSDSEWEYEEKIGYKNQLILIGGGHCALAFSQLMSTMDFYIRLYEDRENLNTLKQNVWAHEKIILKDYSELQALDLSGNNCYVVIMTFGYKTDDRALRAVIHGHYKYLGVLGSQAKMKQLFGEWAASGILTEQPIQIYSPIGIPIRSQTPQEIAISIAAEIIQVKNADCTSTAKRFRESREPQRTCEAKD